MLVTSVFSAISIGQTEYSAYTAIGKGVATTFLTDYQCLGINVSALGYGSGFEGKRSTIGTTEFALGMYSPELTKQGLKNTFSDIWAAAFNNDNEAFNWSEKRDAAARWVESDFNLNADFNWLGYSFQSEKFGGIAISIRERYQFQSRFNETTTDILFRGSLAGYFDSLTVVFGSDTSRIANGNYPQDTMNAVIEGTASNPLRISQLTDGTRVKFVWNREYNIGYGRKIFGSDSTFALYGGVGGRFIQSMAMVDFESDGNEVRFYSSTSPSYGIDFGAAAVSNPSAFTSSSNLPSMVGAGYGLDIALSAKFLRAFTVAAAVNNIGSVTYTRNVYTIQDDFVSSVRLNGLDDYNITESINQLLSDGGLLRAEGQQKHVVVNPATIRLGASYQFKQLLNVGVDVVAPFDRATPGSLRNPVWAVGGDIRPFKWLQFSLGFYGGGNYRAHLPVGINFILKGGAYEFGFSSRDALMFFLKDANSLSAAFGFARIRF
jgi:hypothetical protein